MMLERMKGEIKRKREEKVIIRILRHLWQGKYVIHHLNQNNN